MKKVAGFKHFALFICFRHILESPDQIRCCSFIFFLCCRSLRSTMLCLWACGPRGQHCQKTSQREKVPQRNKSILPWSCTGHCRWPSSPLAGWCPPSWWDLSETLKEGQRFPRVDITFSRKMKQRRGQTFLFSFLFCRVRGMLMVNVLAVVAGLLMGLSRMWKPHIMVIAGRAIMGFYCGKPTHLESPSLHN